MKVEVWLIFKDVHWQEYIQAFKVTSARFCLDATTKSSKNKINKQEDQPQSTRTKDFIDTFSRFRSSDTLIFSLLCCFTTLFASKIK